MKKAFIYCRVSTEEQAEQGKSIETQERLCRKWAKDNDYQIAQLFKDEGKSALTLNRPALQDLIATCQEEKNGIDAILVQDTDRLARNTLDHLSIKYLLKKKNIQVISISQPMIDDSPEGNFIDTVLAAANAFQSQITGRKTSKVLEEKAKLGWFPGGLPALGYKNIDNPHPASTLDRKIIGIDTDTAPYIKEMFQMYATSNYNINNIADYLNKKQLTSPRGSKIHSSLVANLLKNRFYIGEMYWKGKRYTNAQHEPLIEKALFERVQTVLQAHNQNTTRKRKYQFLLRGFLQCVLCDGRMWAEKHFKDNGAVHNLYFCPSCRKGTYIDTDKLEKQVSRIVQKIEITQSYVDTVLAKAKQILEETRSNEDSERLRLQAEKSKLEKAMKEAEDSRFIHHTLTDETFQRIYSRYEQQKSDVDNETKRLSVDHSKRVEVLKKVLVLAENIGTTYQEANFITQRGYLGLFFKNFEVKNGKITDFSLSDELKPLVENGSVRVSNNGLPRVDSNHEP